MKAGKALLSVFEAKEKQDWKIKRGREEKRERKRERGRDRDRQTDQSLSQTDKAL